MPTVEVLKPSIVTFAYKQLKDDEDYGTCLWARFNLDLVNYSMTIESDCGDYSYSWTPTPETESFLHLCSRFNKDYLLGKLSSQSRIDDNATWKAILENIEDNNIDTENIDLRYLKGLCFAYSEISMLFNELEKEIENLGLSNIFETATLWDCIIMDYPYAAVKIVDVFLEHIVPKIKEYEEDKQCKD